MSTLVALPEPIGLSIREQVRGRAALLATWLLLARYRHRPGRLASRLAARARHRAPATAQQARHAQAVITTLSLRCGSGRGCLPRSIATALACRALYRTWPTWRVGMRYPPLMSHAWVQADGQPVGEDPEVIAAYTPTFTVAPEGA
ncbi:lasso peptide biosynthesis B2 protein [Nonomuraea sp. KM90]|uniref:lasso peptide biosynthesis B2 protein n=1 Tax=Nonomuraea sp. KM90 TaxID=3457428 RepID=UPI003FCE62F2